MTKNLPFTVEEYRRRVAKTKAIMDKSGMELLLVTDPANMNYLTGYDGWSFYVHQGVIVSQEDAAPFWFGREQDSNGARLTSWLPDDGIWGYPDHYVQSRYTHTMRWVADLLQAARICENVMQTAIEEIDVGVWEKDVAAKVCAAQIAGTDEYGGSAPAIFPIMPSAERTSTAHLTFDPDRRYRKNDVVLLELSGARHRYHAPLSRTVFLGNPPEDLAKTADGVVQGLQATLAFIKPGVTAEAVEEHWRKAIAHTGVVKPSRVGYSYGLNYVPDWGEHTVSLRPGDKTVLEPGMTLHFMPGIWLETYGFECSEPILITQKGCEKFIDFAERLFVKQA
jgi:ectoine hydrolase